MHRQYLCLEQVIENRTVRNRKTHITFVDIQRANDTMPVYKLCRMLDQTRINHTYIEGLKEVYRLQKV